MFKLSVIKHKVTIDPSELKNSNITKITDIDTVLLDNIKSKIGDICIQGGYVKKDSISIIRRTIGTMETQFLNGMLVYNLQLKAELCSPQKGDIIADCEVIGRNRMGIMAKKGPLEIVLASVRHKQNQLFDTIQTGNSINIEVIGVRFELYDDTISIIGKLI
jgi:hypothetical protein